MPTHASKGGERVVEAILPGFAEAMHTKARLGAPAIHKKLTVDMPTLKKVDPKLEKLKQRLRHHPFYEKRAKELQISVDQLAHIYELGDTKADHIVYMLEHGVPYEDALKDAETLVLLDNK